MVKLITLVKNKEIINRSQRLAIQDSLWLTSESFFYVNHKHSVNSKINFWQYLFKDSVFDLKLKVLALKKVLR